MASISAHIAAVRRFNRAYTNVAGLLDEGLLRTRYSLTEARVIFELAQRDSTEVTSLRAELGLDPGYMSRILARFEADGLVRRRRSETDRRRQAVTLMAKGRAAFRTLDGRSTGEVRALLAPLPDRDRQRLVGAMRAIESILAGTTQREPFLLREPRAGEFGWILERHGALYAEEYGWGAGFEALVARVVADYLAHHDSRRERAWIAERDGAPAGCALCVERDERVAQLRLLLVEPRARGAGIGTALVDECIRFAREAGYREIALWTNDVLEDARRIYERAGFELRESEPHDSFGREVVGQSWSRAL